MQGRSGRGTVVGMGKWCADAEARCCSELRARDRAAA